MLSDRELEQVVRKSQAANDFLDNPQFKQSVEDRKTQIFNDWVHSATQDQFLREKLWQDWHALDRIISGLRKPIDDGTIAQSQLDRHKYQREMENS